MDNTKYLILVKNKNEEDYQDKTAQVTNCKYINGQYNVTFDNGKTYPYNYANVKYLSNPNEIDVSNITIYINGMPENDIISAYDFGNYIKITYEYKPPKVYSSESVRFESSCLNNSNAKNCFEYFKKLSKLHHINDSEVSGTFLADQYKKINKVNEQSILGHYLLQKLPPKDAQGVIPIFPFGINLSQKSATEKALNEHISIIEGPPGTGKTQTILNIIANAVVAGKSVAVVSNNNSATSNVQEKLKKSSLDFFTALLGNRCNKDKFFSEQSATYPDLSEWKLEYDAIHMLKSNIAELQSKLTSLLDMQNKSANFKQELSNLLIEKQYFDDYFNENCEVIISRLSIYKLSPSKILSLLIAYQENVH